MNEKAGDESNECNPIQRSRNQNWIRDPTAGQVELLKPEGE